MLKKLVLLAVLALFTASFLGAQEIGYDDFYNDLAPYGQWIEVAPFGWVWSPADVPADWRPYGDGWWVYSDYGWTFESDRPYAWAVYHYGRWLLSDDYGWVWVPGTDWAPAWVAWRYGDDFIGWAPLPPQVGWSDNYGLVLGSFNLDTDISWVSWIFIDRTRFLEPRVSMYIHHWDNNRDYLRRTHNVTRYSRVNRKIFNPGVPIKDAERFIGRKVNRYRVVDSDKRDHRPVKDNQIPVYKPPVNKRPTVNPRDLPDNRKWGTPEDLKRKHAEVKRPVADTDVRRDKELPSPRNYPPPRKDEAPVVRTDPRDNKNVPPPKTYEPPKKDQRQVVDIDPRQKRTPPPAKTYEPPKKDVTQVDPRKQPVIDQSKQPNDGQPADKGALDEKKKKDLEKLKRQPEK
jgi:hypothetical protein